MVCCCFCLIWFFTSHWTVFQSCQDRSSSVEPVLRRGLCVTLKDITQYLRWGLNPQPREFTWRIGINALGIKFDWVTLCRSTYDNHLNKFGRPNIQTSMLDTKPRPKIIGLRVLTIYGCGSHLGHVTRTMWTNFHSSSLRSLHMWFMNGFRGNVWKCWQTNCWRQQLLTPVIKSFSYSSCVMKKYFSNFSIKTLFTLYLIEMPFNAFANRVDPDFKSCLTGCSLFAYGNMIRYDPTLVDLTSDFFVLCTKEIKFIYAVKPM